VTISVAFRADPLAFRSRCEMCHIGPDRGRERALGKEEDDLLPTLATRSTPLELSAVTTQGDPPLHPPFPFWALADRRLFLSASGGSRGRCAGSSLARLPVPLRPCHEARHALRPAHWAHRRCRRPAAASPGPLDVSTLSHLTLWHLTLTSLLPFEPGGLDPVAPEGPTSARCSPGGGCQGGPKALSEGDAVGALYCHRRGCQQT
jgi:hypothetical protein